MEKDMAILMADLSGYTALTETHGAVSAADLIDKYIDIVKNCLVGDSELAERTGDEVMIVSASADFLLATAIMIIQNTSKEHNFLQLHGGMHYGKVLKRNDSYFGTAINLTSRIASTAGPGSFWCSEQFVNALSDKTMIKMQSKGRYSFKNLNQENDLFEMFFEQHNAFYIDPVCRMLIVNKDKAIPHPKLENIFFCSPGCLEKYLETEIVS